jgi:hypothetical protein
MQALAAPVTNGLPILADANITVAGRNGGRGVVVVVAGDGDVMALLECPVCLDYPRGEPVYTCKNGHLVCGTCRHGVADKCPTCRDANLTISAFASRIADRVLVYVSLACRFAIYGCNRRDRLSVLAVHEERCMYRVVRCPSTHRGTCSWQGSLAAMVKHVKKEECVLALRNENDEIPDSPFRSLVSDFSSQMGISVFDRSLTTYWKPIMLVSRCLVQYMLYLTIERSAEGHWYFVVRSFSPKSVINRIRVRLVVFHSGDPPTDNGTGGNDSDSGITESIKYLYEGGVVSHKLTYEEVLTSGRYLLIRDGQLKQLVTGSAIFEYSLQVGLQVPAGTCLPFDPEDPQHVALVAQAAPR